MEIVLLWLDDLDDLVFCGVGLWAPLRRFCLQIGLTAAVGLSVCELSAMTARWAEPLAAVAAASVAVWLCGAAFGAVLHLRTGRPAFA